MKHPSNRELFAYWNDRRGHAKAPERCDFEPSAVRELLGDIFVLSCDADSGFPFRMAGTRLCALLGGDVKDKSFPAQFTHQSRREIEEIATVVCEETLPAIAGVTALAPDRTTAHFELLLLPFAPRAHEPISLTGLLAPFEAPQGALGPLEMVSWRYIHPPVEPIVPRTLRKLALARGLMVYEGLR
ncbi:MULTISPECIES: PAS domain-containing protein [Bradyrhizobium]|uniref:PAS domain-containing protein n=1 Tax=Bradyrhizobium TaxID=374 RepID=UPI00155474E8|nr:MULTISPECIES: PAS domain-containing protein [Bradyrhizobium]NPU10276.1 PAS domain-containing protein [Bradyrhizobium aeschynomenes]NPV19590.1 PAS domain-containing protein [Bradyrhizobium aeschynomenes]